jgi:hypothetical protein
MVDDNPSLNIDSTIRDSLEYYDKNREKYDVFFNKIKYLKFVDNNNLIDNIIFYDSNKKVLLESSYEILGIYLPKSKLWKWSWSIPTIHKKYTYISRKILEYAFNLDYITELPLKSDLINSKIKIMNDLQLDIHIALSSYLGKKPVIFKFYNKLDDIIDDDVTTTPTDNNEPFYKYAFDDINNKKNHDVNNENYMIIYYFIIEHDNIKL